MTIPSEPIEQHSFEAKKLKVSGVTVYSDRAEVTRLVTVSLKKGKNEVLVKNVSHLIDKDSVRVDGRGPAVICEVQYQQKATKKGDADQDRIKELTTERTALEKKRLKLEGTVKVLTRQGEVLDGVAQQIGKGSSSATTDADDKKKDSSFVLSDDSLTNLAKFLSFYDENTTTVQDKLRSIEEEIKQVNEDIEALDRRINELRYGDHGDYSRDISVLLDSEEGGEVELDVSYQVYGASWAPSYDIRVYTNSNNPKEKSTMKILYYGMITQNTAEDWTDTNLLLSTATPSVGGVIPTLPTRVVDFYRPPQRQYNSMAFDQYAFKSQALGGSAMRKEKRKSKSMMPMGFLRASVRDDDEYSSEGGGTECAMTRVDENVISTCFVIARPSTIPSDGTEHKVNVTVIDLEPRFEHETVPCKTPVAFLTAKVINTSTFPLLPGPTSIYLNNSFVAKSTVKAVSPKEEFDCSLGADPAVRVDYKPAHKFHEQTGFVSKTAIETYEQRIEIKNTKVGEKVKVILREQIPKSSHEKIKVTVLQPDLPKKADEKKLADSPIKLDKNDNLEWTVHIAPNETRELVIKYKIEHPSHDEIEFRQA